jgi:hypothetical protein
MMEFHISREARDRYQVSDTLFNFVGNVIFGDLTACRELAYRINEVRGTADDPERAVHPGALFAMGLIDEVSHALIAHYRAERDPEVTSAALAWFTESVGEENVEGLLRTFVQEFPNVAIYRGQAKLDEWLEGSTDGLSHREAVLEELILLWLANQNPAFRPYRELYDDTKLAQSTAYAQVTAELGSYFATRPDTGLGKGNLLDLLRAPMEAAPESLSGQLAWIRQNWAGSLSGALGEGLRRVLLAADVLKEEEVAIWMRFHPASEQWHHDPFPVGNVRGEVPVFERAPGERAGDPEYERFSPDVDWMPNVVMIAKSTYVWLAQLSRQYGRAIERLDQIPDEELDLLAQRGLNALWLIGIWERSSASQTIKRLCGQPEAVASAYSLGSYHIAWDLGGDYAYGNLRDRAARRGIRLASDMVPNHMGIDSGWVIEHPEWFLSRPDSPYPAYRFDGPDLSNDGRGEIKIEDHYYNQSDAAVVFRRRDNQSGEIRYVYHGNDGTSFPWNDTAQLNYLRADVREQVIQTILHVARQFPIIRFDAAMTLARKHVQRLWFPLPGTGGSIPSRAEASMTQEEFDAAMPHEFWREVVDRVAAEVPGTLLLAEAFWLLEGYFVRTLGMHRVYNSAFMNMLRDEENAKYRMVIKNTIEFDPDILKRYVNFMSNPDERTAIDQFGTGDKYFGVCTVMATLPGLPMFGHGQVEAFTEKYGMEYKRPRYEETPNEGLVERHQREIAPLLKSRALFAESSEFSLFDFHKDDGVVDENVFAYSNRSGDRRALVVFHNKFGETSGTLHRSAAGVDKATGALHQRYLHQALGLDADEGLIFGYHDNATGMHHLRRSTELTYQGLRLSLRAYQYHVLQYWRVLRSTDEEPWEALCDELNGRGVWNLDEALAKYRLRPVHQALRKALDPTLLRCLADIADLEDSEHGTHISRASQPPCNRDEALEGLVKRAEKFFVAANAAFPVDESAADAKKTAGRYEMAQAYGRLLLASTKVPQLEDAFAHRWPADARVVLPSRSPKVNAMLIWAPVAAWCLTEALVKAYPERNGAEIFDRLYLRPAMAESFRPLGLDGEDAYRAAARVRILLADESAATGEDAALRWADPDVVWLTGLHEADGVRWFNKEAHEQLLWWSRLPELIALAAKKPAAKTAPSLAGAVASIGEKVTGAAAAAKKAGYRLDRLPGLASGEKAAVDEAASESGNAKKAVEAKDNLSGADLSEIDPALDAHGANLVTPTGKAVSFEKPNGNGAEQAEDGEGSVGGKPDEKPVGRS